LHLFPPEKQSQLLMDLSLNLKAIISQRLVPKKEGSGRALAMEIVLNSPLISDSIFRGELLKIKEVVKRSRDLGMQTFDQSLFDLYDAEKISYENALRFADSHNDLRLMLKLQSKQAKALDFTKNNPDLDII
jgi:twitching motility protein PilU